MLAGMRGYGFCELVGTDDLDVVQVMQMSTPAIAAEILGAGATVQSCMEWAAAKASARVLSMSRTRMVRSAKTERIVSS